MCNIENPSDHFYAESHHVQLRSRKVFTANLATEGADTLNFSLDVVCIKISKRKLQKLMLVMPLDLARRVLFHFARRRRRIRDLRDQIGRRSFCQAIHEDTQQRYFRQDVEANAEAKEHSFSVTDPETFLICGIPDASKVWF